MDTEVTPFEPHQDQRFLVRNACWGWFNKHFCWREKMSAMERPSKPPTRSISRYKVSSCRGIGFDERHVRFVESFLTLPTEIAYPAKHSKCLTNFPTSLQEKSQDTAPRLRSCHIFFSLWRREATPRLRQVGLCVPPRRTGRWCR